MSGTVRKRGDNWYYRYYDNTGKQVERKGGKTKKEALKKLNEVIYAINNGSILPSSEEVKSYINMWLEEYIKGEKSDNTYYKYKVTCDKYIIPCLGNIKLEDLKVIHIEKYLKYLKKSEHNLNATSIQNHYGVLRTALNKAVKLQLINDNPCRFIDTPKRNKFKAETLTIDEIQQIREITSSDNYEDYIFNLALDLTLELGLRRGEMCGLIWQDIDFINNTVSLNRALIRQDKIYTISNLKTEESYATLPISQHLCDRLKMHKKMQSLNKLKYGEYYIKTNIFDNIHYDLVFTWENGKYIIPSNFLQRIKRLCKRCNIDKNIRWHDLRHTNATLLLENNVNMKVVQERLRHANISTTANIYSHVTEKMNRDATSKIDSVLNSTRAK